jgi:hypothetical protein
MVVMAVKTIRKSGRFKNLKMYPLGDNTYQLIDLERDEEECHYVHRSYDDIDMIGLISLVYHRLDKLKKSLDGLPRRVPISPVA